MSDSNDELQQLLRDAANFCPDVECERREIYRSIERHLESLDAGTVHPADLQRLVSRATANSTSHQTPLWHVFNEFDCNDGKGVGTKLFAEMGQDRERQLADYFVFTSIDVQPVEMEQWDLYGEAVTRAVRNGAYLIYLRPSSEYITRMGSREKSTLRGLPTEGQCEAEMSIFRKRISDNLTAHGWTGRHEIDAFVKEHVGLFFTDLEEHGAPWSLACTYASYTTTDNGIEGFDARLTRLSTRGPAEDRCSPIIQLEPRNSTRIEAFEEFTLRAMEEQTYGARSEEQKVLARKIYFDVLCASGETPSKVC